MKYFLQLPVTGDTPEVEISETDFSVYRESMKVLFGCLAIEKKYEILISNYHELEQEILHVTATHMVRGIPRSPHDFRLMMDLDFKLMIDLRLVNLLTSARLYLDHLTGHVRDCLPRRTDVEKEVKELCAAEYDNHMEYRFMEALRNHVQHRGLAVHTVSLSEGYAVLEGEKLIMHSLDFRTLKSELAMDGNFKRAVLDEIPQEVHLKLATRSYVESLSIIHNEIRNLIVGSVKQARQTVEDAFCQYKGVYGNEVQWLDVQKRDGEKVIEKDSLLLWGDEIRKKLQERNSRLSQLQKRFASNS